MKKTVLVLALFAIISFQINAQWHWQNPTPIGKPIYDMQFLDSLNGYVCGYGGMVLKTANGGLKWEELQVPNDGLIIRIYFLDKDIGWYLSYEDMSLYKTADGGMNWSLVSSFSPKYATTIWFIDELRGFAGGYTNLLKTTDGGINWTEDNSVGYSFSMFFLDGNIAFAGSQNRLYKTSDVGNTWTYQGIPSFDFNPIRIFAYDQNNIYLVGTGLSMFGDPINLFYQTSDGGTTWSAKTFEHTVTDVFFESPTKGFVCAGNIFSTTDQGVSWDTTKFAALRFEFIGTNSWSANYNTIDYSIDGWLSATPQINGIFSGLLLGWVC